MITKKLLSNFWPMGEASPILFAVATLVFVPCLVPCWIQLIQRVVSSMCFVTTSTDDEQVQPIRATFVSKQAQEIVSNNCVTFNLLYSPALFSLLLTFSFFLFFSFLTTWTVVCTSVPSNLVLAQSLLPELFLVMRLTCLGDEWWVLPCGNQHHRVDDFAVCLRKRVLRTVCWRKI